jgi:hypothetical protein
MPYPSTPWQGATPETTLRPFQVWPARRAGSAAVIFYAVPYAYVLSSLSLGVRSSIQWKFGLSLIGICMRKSLILVHLIPFTKRAKERSSRREILTSGFSGDVQATGLSLRHATAPRHHATAPRHVVTLWWHATAPHHSATPRRQASSSRHCVTPCRHAMVTHQAVAPRRHAKVSCGSTFHIGAPTGCTPQSIFFPPDCQIFFMKLLQSILCDLKRKDFLEEK